MHVFSVALHTEYLNAIDPSGKLRQHIRVSEVIET